MLGKSKTRQEISIEYGIDRKTLYRWFKEEGIILKGRLINPKEQEKIYEIFGIPQLLSKEERAYYSNKFAKT